MRYQTFPKLRIYLDSTDNSVSIAEQFLRSSRLLLLVGQMGALLRLLRYIKQILLQRVQLHLGQENQQYQQF
nr:MAG TPA: hypothetical protein [Caudoviricetes sp.]